MDVMNDRLKRLRIGFIGRLIENEYTARFLKELSKLSKPRPRSIMMELSKLSVPGDTIRRLG